MEIDGRENKIDKKKIGQKGEAAAKNYLENKGMVLVKENWRCKMGEVDLIMREKEALIFVEVRLRRKTIYGAGYETVARDKIRKLVNTARYYQQKEDYWGDIRFDVVSIEVDEDKGFALEHIKDAFSAD